MQWGLAYLAAGVPAALMVGVFADRGFGVTFAFMMYHLWTTALLFPTAFVANLAFVRLFPRKTWRMERWRGWIAGGLGVILTSGGFDLVLNLTQRTPEMFRGMFGSAGTGVYLAGWFVLLSNLALLVAWLIPSRRSLSRGRQGVT